jgi:hypothetical protein
MLSSTRDARADSVPEILANALRFRIIFAVGEVERPDKFLSAWCRTLSSALSWPEAEGCDGRHNPDDTHAKRSDALSWTSGESQS